MIPWGGGGQIGGFVGSYEVKKKIGGGERRNLGRRVAAPGNVIHKSVPPDSLPQPDGVVPE